MLKNDGLYKGKNVLVCGLARSGLACAVLLRRLGADVTISDLKTSSELEKEARLNGIQLYLGRNPDEIIQNFDMTVISPGIPADLPVFDKARRDGQSVIGEVEAAFGVCGNKIAAVTGTNGKTTTTALLGDMLKNFYAGSETVGNIGVPFSGRVAEIPHGAWAAVELSSYQIETTKTFKPNVAAVLNVTPDHLARHGTMEHYAAIKERVFENQDENDFAILNFDDLDYCRKMKPPKAKIVYFSRKSKDFADGVFIENDKIYIKLAQKTIFLANKSDIKIPGEHNVENTLAAAAAAFCAGVPAEDIRRAIVNFGGVEHRIEFVRTIGGVKYFNDSKATNPESAIKAVESFSEPLIIIAGGSEKNSDYTAWLTLCAEKRVKKIVLIGDTAISIAGACDKIHYNNYVYANDMREAVEKARDGAEFGDVVLLSPACASFGMFDDFEHRGRVFKQVVHSLEV